MQKYCVWRGPSCLNCINIYRYVKANSLFINTQIHFFGIHSVFRKVKGNVRSLRNFPTSITSYHIRNTRESRGGHISFQLRRGLQSLTTDLDLRPECLFWRMTRRLRRTRHWRSSRTPVRTTRSILGFISFRTSPIWITTSLKITRTSRGKL